MSADTRTHVCDRHVAHAGEHAHRPGPPLVVSRSPPQPRPRATADASQPRIRFLSAKVSYTRHHAGDTLARATSLATSVGTSVPVLGTGARALQLRLAFQRGDAAHCSAWENPALLQPPLRGESGCAASLCRKRLLCPLGKCGRGRRGCGKWTGSAHGPGPGSGEAEGGSAERKGLPACVPTPPAPGPACHALGTGTGLPRLAVRGRQTRSRDV